MTVVRRQLLLSLVEKDKGWWWWAEAKRKHTSKNNNFPPTGEAEGRLCSPSLPPHTPHGLFAPLPLPLSARLIH